MNDHERYQELGALALSGALSPGELAELRGHLQICEQCRQICDQYQLLVRDTVPLLAAAYVHPEELESWDDSATRRRLFDRILGEEHRSHGKAWGKFRFPWPTGLRRATRVSVWTKAAVAAGVLLCVSAGAYHLGRRVPGNPAAAYWYETQLRALAQEKKTANEQIEAARKRISQLSEQGLELQGQILKLRSAEQALQGQSIELASARKQADERWQTIAQERNTLAAQLRESEQSYDKIQAELVGLRAERDKALLGTASLETRIDKLTALNRDQERRLKDAEQYLASDRDIRELMGARRLYIADVFDVDSGSRTQKPFGRVFYTENKSLIFYAFDLDQPGIKNASTFQVWGRKETPQGEQNHPLNLGILYMDNASNRRWVMRSDDPKQLAEIDAIFVTVEPHGGSPKPTSKPFLYALLRSEVNHP